MSNKQFFELLKDENLVISVKFISIDSNLMSIGITLFDKPFDDIWVLIFFFINFEISLVMNSNFCNDIVFSQIISLFYNL
jgi:hypothetical protein